MENEKTWQLLIDAINQNKVVPIIGDEFYYAEVEGKKIPYMEFLLNKLLEKFPLPNRLQDSFDEKEISPDFNMIADSIHISNIITSQMYGMAESATNIYYEIEEIVRQQPIFCDERIIRLLKQTNFPIVLTTSFLPGLDSGLNYDEIKAYDKSPRIDICSSNESSHVLYYLFGKCSKMNKSYMVTEDDLLDYMHYWHNFETRPKELCKILSNKFLLVLGCDYPNWLFRFFWHSIQNFNLNIVANDGLKGVVAGNVFDSDNELSRFLSRIHTHTYGDCGKVLDTILSMLPETNETEKPTVQAFQKSSNQDIFISYAHENADAARNIANIFEKYGAKVWFDSSVLIGSDLYDNIIQRKIEECERFVPIMSEFTENAKRGYFRKEWSLAIEELKFRLGSPYISPIIIDNADINSPRFPKEFKDAHILDYRDEDFENAVKKLIRSFR